MSDSEDDSLIIIGGEVNDEAISDVARYNKTGKIGILPSLIYHRHSHGCAGYRDTEGKLVRLQLILTTSYNGGHARS